MNPYAPTTIPVTLQPFVHPTTLARAPLLSERLGVDVIFASEAFQRTGSFKFRATAHLASVVSQPVIVAASSGNFGQALAHACALVGKTAVIVMPNTSAQVKIDAVRYYGGIVDLIDTRVISRSDRVSQLAAQHSDAYVASAFDDPLVICGNASLGRELAARLPDNVKTVVVPIGGGGLAAGVIEGLHEGHRDLRVIGAEPLLANDAARSLRAGRIVVNDEEPQSLADGARTLRLGRLTWPILRSGLHSIVEVPEGMIAEATRMLFHLANLKAEPTGALALGAILTAPDTFRQDSVCCLVSGGNVDPALYGQLIGEPLSVASVGVPR